MFCATITNTYTKFRTFAVALLVLAVAIKANTFTFTGIRVRCLLRSADCDASTKLRKELTYTDWLRLVDIRL